MKKKIFFFSFIIVLTSISIAKAQTEDDDIDLLINDFVLLDSTSHEKNWGVFNMLIGDWIYDTTEQPNLNIGLISCKPTLDNSILVVNCHLPYLNIDNKKQYKSLIIIHYSKTDVSQDIVYNDNNDLFVNLKMALLKKNNEVILTGSEKDSMIRLTFLVTNEKMTIRYEITSPDSSSTLFKWKMIKKKMK